MLSVECSMFPNFSGSIRRDLLLSWVYEWHHSDPVRQPEISAMRHAAANRHTRRSLSRLPAETRRGRRNWIAWWRSKFFRRASAGCNVRRALRARGQGTREVESSRHRHALRVQQGRVAARPGRVAARPYQKVLSTRDLWLAGLGSHPDDRTASNRMRPAGAVSAQGITAR